MLVVFEEPERDPLPTPTTHCPPPSAIYGCFEIVMSEPLQGRLNSGGDFARFVHCIQNTSSKEEVQHRLTACLG
jgi:hypothetical protein